MRTLTLSLLFTTLTVLAFAGPDGRFTYHVVEKGQTLYSISRQYGLKPQDLIQYNESIGENMSVKLGQKIKIPSSAEAAIADAEKPVVATPIKTTRAEAVASADNNFYHTVKKGETVFSISRMYGVSRDDLQAWNGIKELSIKVGQKLVVSKDGAATTAKGPVDVSKAPSPNAVSATSSGLISRSDIENAMKKDGYVWTLPNAVAPKKQAEPKPAAAPAAEKIEAQVVKTATPDATASLNSGGMGEKVIVGWKTESASERRDNYRTKSYDPSAEYESMYYQNIYSGLNKKVETGNVKLLIDNVTDNIAYYNNASIGTILKLTNPDNGKTSYAIVVGKVPSTESSYLVKVSGKVAKALSTKDYSSIEVVCYTGN
jgi:LysM repeat protein